jgi:hypothetical protein
MDNSHNVVSFGRGAAVFSRPLGSFTYPDQVSSDADMDLNEKRAILAAWASDVHALTSHPTLRYLPGTPFPVPCASIVDALVELDRMGPDDNGPAAAPIEPRPMRPLCPASEASEAA